jgi:hypothetical protein
MKANMDSLFGVDRFLYIKHPLGLAGGVTPNPRNAFNPKTYAK